MSSRGPTQPGDFVGLGLSGEPARFTCQLETETRDGLARLLDAGSCAAAFGAKARELLAGATRASMQALAYGHGFILVRGLPIIDRPIADVEPLYRAMGEALGTPVQQNLDGDTLTHVRDEGDDPTDPAIRLYRTRAAQDFHTDGADVIGLLCLRAARAGGASRVVSSVRVFERMKAARPDLAELLLEPWSFHLPGGKARGLPEAFPRSIVTVAGSKTETFFIPWYLERAQELESVPRWTQRHAEAFALYTQLVHEPDLSLAMEFLPGDVQWLRNAYVLHARDAYEDDTDPAQRRHLLRLWLSAAELDDRTPRFEELPGLG